MLNQDALYFWSCPEGSKMYIFISHNCFVDKMKSLISSLTNLNLPFFSFLFFWKLLTHLVPIFVKSGCPQGGGLCHHVCVLLWFTFLCLSFSSLFLLSSWSLAIWTISACRMLLAYRMHYFVEIQQMIRRLSKKCW